MNIKLLEKSDIPAIIDGFANSGWATKPQKLLEQYLGEQKSEKRTCFVAFIDNQFAGYVTLKWQSSYKHFARDNIPEISDVVTTIFS